MAGDGMRFTWVIVLILLIPLNVKSSYHLPDKGILTITTNMGNPQYFERERMYLFYSRDFYLLEFPYAKKNDSENVTFTSFIFKKFSVEQFIQALNSYGFEEYTGNVNENGGFVRINYTGGRSAQLYLSDRTYLVFEEKKEKKIYVSPLEAKTAQGLLASLLDEGERYSVEFIRMTYSDSDRKAFTKFNNNLKTVKVWTDVFSDKEVVSVIWQPCGCRHDSSDPNYNRFNKAYLYFYLAGDQMVGKNILKEVPTMGEAERDVILLEKDYLAHNKIEIPPPTQTPLPTETPPPTQTLPPTQPPSPTPPPTEPPPLTPAPPPTISQDAFFSFSFGLLFGGIAFTTTFFAGVYRRKRKPFK